MATKTHSLPLRIPLAKPSMDSVEAAAIIGVIESGWITQGPRVLEFEQDFSLAVNAKGAAATSSGTAALFMALKVLGIGAGDEVIVPSLSFVATANSIVHCNATPVFIDIEPDTYNLDPTKIEPLITDRTRAVMVVHQLGLPASLNPILDVAAHYGLEIIEDAACAVGANIEGRCIGDSDNLVCFSFHPRKILTTGEGGMVTSNRIEHIDRIRRLRHQGMSSSDFDRHNSKTAIIENYPEVGFNFRMSDLHAAIGIAQLRKLGRFLKRRKEISDYYDYLLAPDLEIGLSGIPEGTNPSYQSYIVRLIEADEAKRNAVIQYMLDHGIATRRGLMACHLEPCYKTVMVSGDLKNTETAAAQTILLPIYPELSRDEQEQVVDTLIQALKVT